MSEYPTALFQVLDTQLEQLDRSLNRAEASMAWLRAHVLPATQD